MKDTYFFSYYGYRDFEIVSYGSGSVSREILIENEVQDYVLKLAKEANKEVETIHIIALNKI